jgi:hypothetical protein
MVREIGEGEGEGEGEGVGAVIALRWRLLVRRPDRGWNAIRRFLHHFAQPSPAQLGPA